MGDDNTRKKDSNVADIFKMNEREKFRIPVPGLAMMLNVYYNSVFSHAPCYLILNLNTMLRIYTIIPRKIKF